MGNTENEGIILAGLIAEHEGIIVRILNTNEDYSHYDRAIKKYEAQLTRIEDLIFKIIDSNPTKECP